MKFLRFARAIAELVVFGYMQRIAGIGKDVSMILIGPMEPKQT